MGVLSNTNYKTLYSNYLLSLVRILLYDCWLL